MVPCNIDRDPNNTLLLLLLLLLSLLLLLLLLLLLGSVGYEIAPCSSKYPNAIIMMA